MARTIGLLPEKRIIKHFKRKGFTMDNAQNVKIPKELFDDIYSFFTHLSLSGYEPPIMHDFHRIHEELGRKLDSINLRNAYTKAVYAEDGLEKNAAFANYIRLKTMNGG